MEGNMWIFATLGLIICWIMPVDSMAIRFNFTLREANIPLSMVEDSVDDMYFGCNEQMMTIVKDKFLPEEKSVKHFGKHWSAAQSCAKKKFDQREDKALTIDHISAICVYTANNVYEEFNTAVRTKGRSYLSLFKYHYLHYLLTSAIQILNNNDYCHSTFRRTKCIVTGKVNQIIRFGSFTSTSYKPYLTHFGNETCFKIKTCLGASLKNYPVLRDHEAEVLIPPYETFKITEIIKGRDKIQGLGDCEVVFVLVSAGTKSSLNCNVVHLK
ncbi:ecto-ADP-ribosyltransferase 4-like [Gymnodraco acuticeps]|uniref:NAD(P)(+)--arginine ADP-ribosyltransferase n=1 Tax=Gymnodraco acuticeps TaxID=8218 RepID=A0A6P8X3F6_GYMAC|nr:ecto-ADP-ribosyltransferase 4-like [Gymnodraco acuticeps]